jgi:peptidoglycan hydrolase-like protein with peptidoglycan-binding domain
MKKIVVLCVVLLFSFTLSGCNPASNPVKTSPAASPSASSANTSSPAQTVTPSPSSSGTPSITPSGTATPSPAYTNVYLKRGDKGDKVRELQSSLNKFNYKLAVDGFFGKFTEYAVKNFQGKVNLTPDGIAGPLTWAKLASSPAVDPYLYDYTAETAITNLVEAFGKKLSLVPLSASKDLVIDGIQKNYSAFVTSSLLAKWQSNPENAPGRWVSSPWPDRIEISAIVKASEDTYKVNGEIIEITSVEMENGGIAAERSIDLVVKKTGTGWLIDDVVLGSYSRAAGSVVYENTQYGFKFYLPKGWKGYTIIPDKWEGYGQENPGVITETGPLLSIRNPLWTSQDPHQDIPIMIFTLAQWNSLQQDKFHIGAAPVGPSELGRNSTYVFALPARYNFAFRTGFEEVENILNGHPLEPAG